MKIQSSNEKLQYCGRIDWSNPQEPVFIYPCTSLGLRFTGNVLKIRVRNKNEYWDNYLGCVIDGKQITLPLQKEGETILEIPVEENATGEHEALLFKRQDSCHECAVLDLEIAENGTLLDMPAKPTRKLEVYGDSVSAGEVSEAVEYVGKVDPEHNGEYSNSWYSYAWMTARKLNAQIHDIAQGGIALIDKTGWFHEPEAVGMESAWDKIHYNTVLAEPMQWDFTQYTPQVVIIAIGQNDSHPDDYMKEDYNGERSVKWRTHYKAFLQKLRDTYPNAQIVCCTTLLDHDKVWDDSIGQVVKELGDDKISQYLYKRNGNGTPGHLRITEAEEMAEELAVYIENLHVEGWD